MRDYRELIPRTPPEGLIRRTLERGLLKRGALIYRKEWVEEEPYAPALEGRKRRKTPMCRVTCTECGQTFYQPYIPAATDYWGQKTGYGFCLYQSGGDEAVTHGDEAPCPLCGETCKVLKQAYIPQCGSAPTDTAFVMSAHVPKELSHGELVLIGWYAERRVTREGDERYTAHPYEAYVFTAKDACKLVSWRQGYSGSAGYFREFCSQWRQQNKWSETWKKETEIYGLTGELLERSCMANSKLDLYMARTLYDALKFPVIYLRLYQKYPQVENLVTAGMSHLLDGVIDPEVRRHQWETKHKGELPAEALASFDLTESRPARMLGLTRDELKAARRDGWDVLHWRVYTKAKAAGDRMQIPEDITLLHRLGDENLERLIGMAPMGKILRYLLRQMERAEATDPYGALEESEINAMLLHDYWTMAAYCGWDLTLKDVRWPKDLPAAHDRAAEERQRKNEEIEARLFAETLVRLWPMRYASGELMLIPAASLEELRHEGAKLHHCVGTYGHAHVSGEPIFFIRRLWAPGEPYYTLNYDEKTGRIIQDHTRYNREQTKEILAFEKRWLAWLRRGMPRLPDGTPVGAEPLIWEAPEEREERKEQKTA